MRYAIHLTGVPVSVDRSSVECVTVKSDAFTQPGTAIQTHEAPALEEEFYVESDSETPYDPDRDHTYHDNVPPQFRPTAGVKPQSFNPWTPLPACDNQIFYQVLPQPILRSGPTWRKNTSNICKEQLALHSLPS